MSALPAASKLLDDPEEACLDYVVGSRRLFEAIEEPDGFSGEGQPAEARVELLRQFLAGMDRAAWTSGIENVLAAALNALGAPAQAARLSESLPISCYPRTQPAHVALFLSWIWRNRLPLTDFDVSRVVRAMLEGTLGYRLIDLHLDNRGLGAEAIVLGTYLIRSHEHCLAGVFGDHSLPVIKRYADLYAAVEYSEKSARWKRCPFSWDDAKRLGWKAAPLFAIPHLLLEKAGKRKSHIEAVIEGFCSLVAAYQLLDDATDACDDLAHGFETLIVSGYYEANGPDGIDGPKVRSFVNEQQIRMFLRTLLGLIDSAVASFQSVDEPLLELFAEYKKHQFLQRWNLFRTGDRDGNDKTE